MSDTMTNAPRRRGRPARTTDVNIENGAEIGRAHV